MPLFQYKAIDQLGNEHISKIKKDDITQVTNHLESKNLIVIEVKKLSFLNSEINDYIFSSKISTKELAVFCRQLSFVLDAGIPITTAFITLEQQTSNKRFKKILFGVYEELLNGNSLSSSLKKSGCFPNFLLSMTEVAERTGRLTQVYSYISTYYEKDTKVSEDIKSAMIYPIIVSVMMFLVVIVSVIYVVPNYALMFESSGIDLPLSTSILIAISSFVIKNKIALFIFLTATISSCFYFCKTELGSSLLDKLKLHNFLFNKIYIKNINLKFVHTLSLLLKSGVDLPSSLYIVRNVLNNKALCLKLDHAIIKMNQGHTFSALIKEISYFEPIICSMIKIGEETGSLPNTMEKCVLYLTNEMDIHVSKLSKLLEPAITIVIGGILAFIMLAITLPTFHMTNIF